MYNGILGTSLTYSDIILATLLSNFLESFFDLPIDRFCCNVHTFLWQVSSGIIDGRKFDFSLLKI